MLSDGAKLLADPAIAYFYNRRPDLSETRAFLEKLRAFLPEQISDPDFESAVKHVEARLSHRMPVGVVVAERGFQKWLSARQNEIEPFFWSRFRQYLLQTEGWGPGVVNSLSENTDIVLEYAGDPLKSAPWDRRGLVVGDVQSGKTAMFTALCNKAADAGYKLIIVLAGTLNSLRSQTQERIDAGFIGRASAARGGDANAALVGVGLFDNKLVVNYFTDTAQDFNQTLSNVGTPLDGMSAPAVLVVKKNKKILENLYRWVALQNRTTADTIDVPLLLIDDEADAASVNTGPESDPRAINVEIRKLLTLFSRTSYVGVTATPFANVFIAPDSYTDMLKDDLFPRDYIYSLEPPNNYLGPVKMFITSPRDFVVEFDDAEPLIPAKHNTALVVNALPKSLLTAMYAFLISNAIRDIRGEGASHRSMLVNVSRANNVQRQVLDLLQAELHQAVEHLKLFGSLSPADAEAQSPQIRRIRDVFSEVYEGGAAGDDGTWEAVLASLYRSNVGVVATVVNMQSKTRRLNYEEYKTDGLRVIAVGGHALSRGLTLQGLCISYISRNSKAYDTLLQMGRWFGYRPGYEDLCRVWMTHEAFAYYQHITEATQELRDELRRMYDAGETPKRFGLKVRAHPDALTVTALVKMRTAKTESAFQISIARHHFESTRFATNPETLKHNEQSVSELIANLTTEGYNAELAKARTSHLWRDVPVKHVAALLKAFRVHNSEGVFQPQQIAQFLTGAEIPELASWTVAIVNGGGKHCVVGGFSTAASVRKLEVEAAREMFTVGAIGSARLGNADDDSIGMMPDELEVAQSKIADAEKAERRISKAYQYRCARRQPLLLIYMVQATPEPYVPGINPFAAIGLAFPDFNDELPERQVVYQTNRVYQQMKFDLQVEEDEDINILRESDLVV